MTVSTWTNAVSGSWGTSANWTGGIPFFDVDTATFNAIGVTAASYAINLGGIARPIGTVNLSNGLNQNYVLNFGTLDMQGVAVINVSAAGALGSVFGSALILDINLGATITTTSANAQLTHHGIIIGTGQLTKAGAGTLTLTNSGSTWTGGTVITGGKVVAGNSNVLGALVVNNVLAASVAISAGATLDMNGFNQTIGNLSGAGTITSASSGFLTLTSNGTFGATFSGVIQNGSATSLGLTKTGTGLLLLSNAGNTYTGLTTINGGVLKGGVVNATSANSSMSIGASGTFDLGGFNQSINFLSGLGTITNSGVAATVTQTNAGTSTFNGKIQNAAGFGALGLTKAGTGTLVLAGANNTYTGATIVSSGTLKAGALNAFGVNSDVTLGNLSTVDLAGFNQSIGGLSGGSVSAAIINSGVAATLTQNNAVNLSYSGTIQDAIALTKNGVGTLSLSGTNTYTGATLLNQGILAANNTNALGSLSNVTVASGATLQVNANQTIGTLAGAGTINGGAFTLSETNALATSFTGAIQGSVGISKGGAGKLTLTGLNTYSGTTTLSGGTLEISLASQLGGAGHIVFAGAGTLRTTTTMTLAKGLDVNAGVSGAIAAATGTTLTFTGLPNTYAGAGSVLHFGSATDTGTIVAPALSNLQSGMSISVDGGTLQGNSNFFNGAGGANIAAGATLILAGPAAFSTPTFTSLTGAGLVIGGGTPGNASLTINNASASLFSGVIIDGANPLDFNKGGAGTLTLSGSNTFSGATNINGGTLKLAAFNVLNANTNVTLASGATLDLGGFSHAFAALNGLAASQVTNSGVADAVLTVNSVGGHTFAGALTDGATNKLGLTLNMFGNLQLAGANSYSGATIVNSGSLQVNAANTLSVASDMFIAGGADLYISGFSQSIGALSGAGDINGDAATLTQTNAGATTYSGSYSGGAGNFVKNGAGTLTFSGNINYSGATNVNAGALVLTGATSLINSSAVTLAAGATLDVTGLAAGDVTLRSLNGGGAIALGGKSLQIDGQAGNFSGAILGTGGSETLTIQLEGASPISLAGATFSNWNDAVNTITIFSNNNNASPVSITGSSRADLIFGGILGDTLIGGGGTDTLNGGEGNDTLSGGGAAAGQFNLLNGDNGVDTASYLGTLAGVYADLNTNAGIVGGVLTDLYTSIENVIGGDGNDTLNGDGVNNRLSGGLGDDLLFGNIGDDTLVGGGHVVASFNQLFGGAGVDLADYSAETGRVFVDLRAPAGHIDNGGGYILNDLMNSIENVIGGANDDTLVGDDATANVLFGGGGTDLLFGFDGDDTLVGGAATIGQYNQLFGGAGSDTASYTGTTSVVYSDLNVLAGWVANGGNALILTNVYNSIENLVGGSAGDSLIGDNGANVITGAGAADLLYANLGAGFDNSIDRFIYNSAADSNLTTGYDTITNFKAGQDLLDFSAFHIDAAQVSIASGGGATSVYANTDGIAGFDLALVVLGNNALTTADIVF